VYHAPVRHRQPHLAAQRLAEQPRVDRARAEARLGDLPARVLVDQYEVRRGADRDARRVEAVCPRRAVGHPLEQRLERQQSGLDAPRIEVGAPANLVLLDENSSWQVTEEGFRSRSVNSWLLGKTLRGKVRLTVANGRVVHEG